MYRRLFLIFFMVGLLCSLAPLIAGAQGGHDSWQSINMTGVDDSYLVIGMQGGSDSRLIIESSIVVYNLTGLHVYPVNCSFGLLRPGDIRYTGTAFTILNASNVSMNVTIGVSNDWIGGINWTHSDDCLPGVDTVGLIAVVEDGSGHRTVIVRKTEGYNYLVANLEPDDTIDFGLQIYAPTQFSDYRPKSNTVFVSVEEA